MTGSTEPAKPRTAAGVFALRKTHWRNSYRPVPIYTQKKRPRGDNWCVEALQDPPVWSERCQEQIALRTGLATGAPVAADIDVLIQPMTDQIVRAIEQIVGPAPLVRIGRAPKILLGFRCEEPFRKLSTRALVMPDGSKVTVEILADGQQFVADGILMPPTLTSCGKSCRPRATRSEIVKLIRRLPDAGGAP